MPERVTFHEITKEAVNAAFLHPGMIDTHKVEAQQAAGLPTKPKRPIRN
jgi:DNA topoisomerase IA